MFGEVGCLGEDLTRQTVKGTKLPNVICRLPGDSDATIIVGAHFDHTSLGEGVADNWSGAALLPSLYQSLKNSPREHTLLFIGFTDEEKGLRGSRFYVDQLKSSQAGKIQAMVNLDTLGLSPIKLWRSHSDPALIKALDRIANRLNVKLGTVNVENLGTSDSESFARRNIPRITLHSVTRENFQILHSRRDRMSALHLDDYYDAYRLIVAYLAFLDSNLNNAPAKETPQQE